MSDELVDEEENKENELESQPTLKREKTLKPKQKSSRFLCGTPKTDEEMRLAKEKHFAEKKLKEEKRAAEKKLKEEKYLAAQ